MIRLYTHLDQSTRVSVHEKFDSQIFPASIRPKGWPTSRFCDLISYQDSNQDFIAFEEWSSEITPERRGFYLIHYGSVQELNEHRAFIVMPPKIRNQINQGLLDLLITFVWEAYDGGSISEWQQDFSRLLTELDITRSNSVVALVSAESANMYRHRDRRISWIFYPWFEFVTQVHSRRSIKIAPKIDLWSPKTYTYLCLNRNPRQHKILMLAWLEHLQISQKGLITWPGGHDRMLPKFDSLNMYGIMMKNYPGFERHILATQRLMGDYQNSDDASSQWQDMTSMYQSCFTELVIETHHQNLGDLVFLTEKTFRPISMGLPFILLGCPKSLQLLRRMGYRTFPSLFDEAYDAILSPIHSMQAIANQLVNLCNTMANVDQEIIDNTAHNRELFWQKNHVKALHAQLLNAQSKT